jgi:CRP-like cAMP-binding protein
MKAQDQLFEMICRHLLVSGLDLANKPLGVTTHMNDTEKLLGLVAIFAPLTDAERKTIASKLESHFYDEGETLLEPGAVVHSLFIVGAGVLSITREDLRVRWNWIDWVRATTTGRSGC